MNPFLSTITLLGIAGLPADAEARRTLLRAARRRWQADFQLEGETMLLHGNSFTLNDIVQRIDALEQEEEVRWHNLLHSVPEIHTFLETGSVKPFLLYKSIKSWPEKEAERTREAFSWQYLHQFRRAWKNADAVLLKALNNLVIPAALQLSDDVDDLRANYKQIELEKLHEALSQLNGTTLAGSALEMLIDEQRQHLWLEMFGTFIELKSIYSECYYTLKRRHAPAEELDALIAGCEAAMPLFAEYNWDMRLLIADHKKPVIENADDDDSYDEEQTPGYNPAKRKQVDDGEDPFPVKKEKWYHIGPATLIPFLALLIALGLIGWGVWSAVSDKKDTETAEPKRPVFEMRYVPTRSVLENKSIYVNGRRIAYDSLFLAVFYRLSEGENGLPLDKKALLDSLYNKELMGMLLNDSAQTKSSARGIADSLTPLVLPHRDPPPY